MKKMMLMAVVAGAFAFTSCSKDDDGGGDESATCLTCSMTMEGMEISSDYCDNGDGTYTLTSEGQEMTHDIPEGYTFDDLIAAQEALGMTCE